MQFRTVACLPVLSGAWRHRGGGLARSTARDFARRARRGQRRATRPGEAGRAHAEHAGFGQGFCDSTLAPPIRALVVYGANPVVSMPNQGRVRDGLRRDDLFTVVHDLFVTDTALYADYVLPATSQIEHLDLCPAWGHLYLALNRPAIPPRGEAVSNTELFRRLAAALGRTEPWLFESDESMLRGALASGHPWLEGICTSGCGTRATRAWRNPRTGGRLPRGTSPRRQARPSSILRRSKHKASIRSRRPATSRPARACSSSPGRRCTS